MIYTLFTGCPIKGVHISYPLAFLYVIMAYRTKSVCENPYNTRYLLVL